MFHRALALLGVLTTLAPAAARSGEPRLPSHLLAGLEAMEYEVRATESGLQAPNRAQDLRTWFGDRGVDIVPRTRDAQWAWTWTTAAWGRAGAMRSPAASARHVDGNRVEYRGADGLTEWYVNRPDGLEQGFTVAAPPAGNGAIVIVAGMPAGLRAAAADAPSTIDFLDDAGTIVLRYGGLHAWDAEGRTLTSHLAWDDRHIRIIVEDDGAAYPVTIDPVVVSPVWTRAGGKTNAHFGWSVCTAGDVNGDGYSDAIVGAPDWDGGAVGSGAAFVYHGGPNGLQTTAAWNQSGFTLNGRYGHCVSTAGDVNGDGYYDIIVGEPAWTGNQPNEGRALVYHGSASGLSFVPAWTAEWFEAFAETGASVAWAGDVNGDGYDDVLVGIPSDDRSRLPDAGLVRVYHGSASGLSTSAAINLLGQEPGEEFGYSVCTAGDVNADGYSDIAVGSWKWDGPGTDRGRVQVWLGSASGITGSSDWSAEGEADGDLFGAAAATVGDGDGDGYADLIVGAPYYDGFYADVGKVYIYQGNASSLQTTPIWTQNGFNAAAHSGTSVGTPGDLGGNGFADFILGQPDGSSSAGHVFIGSGAPGYSLQGGPVIWGAAGSQVGMSVGTAGDCNGDGLGDMIYGAPMATVSLQNEGTAEMQPGVTDYVMSGWLHREYSLPEFGRAIAVGDWNGDGFQDLAISHVGAVRAWHGSAAGRPDPANPPVWTVTGSAAAEFGAALACAGDVDGDGREELLVGSYLDGAGQEGRFFVYHGSASGLETTPRFTFQDPQDGRLGYSLAGAGDLNDDGYADIIVGSPRADLPLQNEGAARIWLGSATGIHQETMITLKGNRAAGAFGWSVAGAGDVDADGHADVIVGAPSFENQPGVYAGRAFVYRGTDSGVSTSSYWQGSSSGAGDDYGYSVDTAGDVNGDGRADIVVGCPGYDFAPSGNEGTAFVYLALSGGGFGTGTSFDLTHLPIGRFGEKVVGIGDTNADGCSDLVIGAPLSEAFHDPEGGAIYFFQGSPTGISTVEQLIEDGSAPGEHRGRVIVAARDTNGDGFADWCIGSPDQSGVGNGPGYFSIRLPNSILGTRRVDARQLDSTGNLILKNGTSDLHDGFRVAMTGFSAAGRADLRLEVEVTDVTTGAVTTDVGPWVDPGAPVAGLGCVVSFDRLQSGLAAGGNYAWRARVAARHPMFPHGPWRTMQSWAPGLEAVRTKPPVGTDAPVVAAASDLGIRVWPNPFREGLTAAVRTAAAGPVRVEVIDVAGRRIATIADGNAPAGFHEFTWDGMDTAGGRTAAGVYLLRITTDDGAGSRKVIRLR